MSKAVVVSAKRSVIGKFQKSLASVKPETLGAMAMKAVLDDTGIDPATVDEVIFANLFNYYMADAARYVWLEAGLPHSVPALQIDRQCGSSLNAIALAAMEIETGNAKIILTGGVESYSHQPFMVARPEGAYPRNLEFIPYEAHKNGLPMILTAENIASRYGISREECDRFSLRSHQLAAAAWEQGLFADQVFPVPIPQKKGDPKWVTADDCVRFDASYEGLARLKPVMKADGVVTAGNSSPMNDGASAVLVMSEEKAKELGLEPLATVSAWAAAGCDPDYMGLGPIYAIRKLLQRTGKTIDDIDLYEINEAFAAQTLGCVRELGIPEEKLNVNGGAIAIGHPNAASGGILTARLLHEMKRRDASSGIISFCCGGGQGISVLFERY